MGTEQVLSKMTSAPSTTSAPSDDYNDIFYEDYIDFYDGGNDKDVEEVDDDDGEKTEKEGYFFHRVFPEPLLAFYQNVKMKGIVLISRGFVG